MSKETSGRVRTPSTTRSPTADSSEESSADQQPTPIVAPRPGRSTIDDVIAGTCCAHFCGVTCATEEPLVDPGLHLNPLTTADRIQPVEPTQQFLLSDFTAQRLSQAHHLSAERYKAAVGVLEADFTKRAVRCAPASATGPG